MKPDLPGMARASGQAMLCVAVQVTRAKTGFDKTSLLDETRCFIGHLFSRRRRADVKKALVIYKLYQGGFMLKPCFVACMIPVCLTVLNAGIVCGQNYPIKPIRIITSGVGGGNDFMSRMIAQRTASGDHPAIGAMTS